MRAFIHFSSLCVLIAAILSGCASPERRAQAHAAVFKNLSPADQHLVLRGRVRHGLAKEGVWIAWGEPARKLNGGSAEGGKGQTATETWIYERHLTTHVAMGSSDQWQPGSRRASLGTPLICSPGFGFGGIGYEGWLLYRPRVQYTDSYLRRVTFVNGKLDAYSNWYGETLPFP